MDLNEPESFLGAAAAASDRPGRLVLKVRRSRLTDSSSSTSKTTLSDLPTTQTAPTLMLPTQNAFFNNKGIMPFTESWGFPTTTTIADVSKRAKKPNTSITANRKRKQPYEASVTEAKLMVDAEQQTEESRVENIYDNEEKVQIRDAEIRSMDADTDAATEALKRKMIVAQYFEDKFSCPICLEVVHDPLQSDACRHVFCAYCLLESIEKKADSPTCPTCQKAIKNLITPPTMLVQLIEEYLDMEPEVRLDSAELVRRKERITEMRLRFEARKSRPNYANYGAPPAVTLPRQNQNHGPPHHIFNYPPPPPPRRLLPNHIPNPLLLPHPYPTPMPMPQPPAVNSAASERIVGYPPRHNADWDFLDQYLGPFRQQPNVQTQTQPNSHENANNSGPRLMRPGPTYTNYQHPQADFYNGRNINGPMMQALTQQQTFINT